jgi:predicted ATPase
MARNNKARGDSSRHKGADREALSASQTAAISATPPSFVARERELALLQAALERSALGHGQVKFILGQAGSGKTVLMERFIKQALETYPDLVVAMGSGNAQTGTGDPYLPFREALAMLTGSPSEGQARVLRSAGGGAVAQTALARTVQILLDVAPELVGLFVPGAAIAGAVGKAMATQMGWMKKLDKLAGEDGKPAPEQQRIFEQYTAFIQRLSQKAPVLLFLDDLHWADTASLGLLFHLARRIDTSRVLIIGAYRPSDVALGRDGDRHPLEPIVHELMRYHGEILLDLDGLSEQDNRTFVDALIDVEPNRLPESFRDALYHHTGGHALFTVELIQTLRDRSTLARDEEGLWFVTGDLDWRALPARVEGVIEERVGRLDPLLRELLTIGSIEGESFSAEVVARVHAIAERQAVRKLSQDLERQHRLIRAQGRVRLGSLQLSLYRFMHNLFQQYVYGSLDEAERAYLHRDVGEVVEALFAGETGEVAAQLARHFEVAGIFNKAASYRREAAMRALGMSAHREAIVHAEEGIADLEALRAGPERDGLEMGLQIALGVASVGANGYSSPQVHASFNRARELALALDDPIHEIPALYGLCGAYFVAAEFHQSQELGHRLVALAQGEQAEGFRLGGQLVLGSAALYQGDMARARADLEEAIAFYDPDRHRNAVAQLTQDPCVASYAFLGWILWSQGYPEQALRASEAALTLARHMDHPYSLGFALTFSAVLHQMLGDDERCRDHVIAALEVSRQHGFPSWQAMGNMIQAWTLAREGKIEQGIVLFREGLQLWHAIGARLGMLYFTTRLAEIYLMAGRREEGLRVLDESTHHPEEVWWLPDYYRVRAELLLLEPGAEREAEEALRRALTTAEAHGTRALGLRSAMSLAQLLQGRVELAAARQLLAEHRAWFTEGAGTRDQQEASRLLAELALEAPPAAAPPSFLAWEGGGTGIQP